MSSLDPVVPPPEKNELRVRRGRVESVDLYEIKENELELLEKGAPAELYLNFAIFLLSLSFGAVTAVGTATFANSRIELLFFVVAVVGSLGGIFLLILWWRTRQSIAEIVKRIRARIPPEVARASSASSNQQIAPQG